MCVYVCVVCVHAVCVCVSVRDVCVCVCVCARGLEAITIRVEMYSIYVSIYVSHDRVCHVVSCLRLYVP